jgi:peptidyl-prolyl cis-trans isomerase D
MLQAIRSRAASVVVKALFVLLILSFGIWGIGDIFRSHSPETVVATVGDRSIRAEELQTALRPVIERLNARLGGSMDLPQAKKLGVVDEVLRSLIDASVLDQEAARLRLEVSDDVIRNSITRNPSFQGANGAFDPAAFRTLLAANRMSEDQYVARLRADIPRQDLLLAASVGAAAPQPIVDALYRYRSEKRVADVVALPNAGAGDVGQPSEEELTKFYDAHPDLFRAPEYRGFTLVSLSPSDLSQGIEVSEARLKDEYDQRQDEFVLPERRDVQQILLPSEEKAKEAEAALAAGRDWTEVATTIAGQKPETIDLGLTKRDEMPKELGDVAFELPLDKASEPIQSSLGWHILRVVKIEPPATQSFAEVKAKLEAEVARREAVDRVYKLANQVDDALAGGATLDDAAAKFGLKKTVVEAVDEAGQDRDGKTVPLPVAPAEVLKLAFATEQGHASRVTETTDDAIFALKVDKVTPPAVRPLAEVKDKAIAAWREEQQRERVTKEAEALAAAVGPDKTLAALAGQKGLKATTTAPLLRSPGRDSTVAPALVAKLFAAKPGEAVTAEDASGAFVAQLTQVQASDQVPDGAAAQLSRELAAGLQRDLGEELTQALRAQFPVDIKRVALDQMF